MTEFGTCLKCGHPYITMERICESCAPAPSPVAPGEQETHCARCGYAFTEHGEGPGCHDPITAAQWAKRFTLITPSAPAPRSGEEEVLQAVRNFAYRIAHDICGQPERTPVIRQQLESRLIGKWEAGSCDLTDALHAMLDAATATLTARLAAAEQQNRERRTSSDQEQPDLSEQSRSALSRNPHGRDAITVIDALRDRLFATCHLAEEYSRDWERDVERLEARARALEEENARLRDDLSKAPRMLPPVMLPELTFDDEPEKAP